jgi:hypothetical protein
MGRDLGLCLVVDTMNRHLKLSPHRMKGQSGVWWYEDPGGIEIRVENTAINPNTGQATVRISWKSIRSALNRKDRK